MEWGPSFFFSFQIYVVPSFHKAERGRHVPWVLKTLTHRQKHLHIKADKSLFVFTFLFLSLWRQLVFGCTFSQLTCDMFFIFYFLKASGKIEIVASNSPHSDLGGHLAHSRVGCFAFLFSSSAWFWCPHPTKLRQHTQQYLVHLVHIAVFTTKKYWVYKALPNRKYLADKKRSSFLSLLFASESQINPPNRSHFCFCCFFSPHLHTFEDCSW